MPFCARCSRPFVCTCSSLPPKQLDDVAEKCPLNKKAAIWVHVLDDRGMDIKQVQAKHSGAAKHTDDSGTSVFDPVDPGGHTVDLGDLDPELLKLFERPVGPTQRDIHVAPGQIAYVPYQLARKPALKVKVVEKGKPEHLFVGATVSLTGAESASKPTEAGIADFGRVASGKYAVKVKLTTEDEKTFATSLDFTTAQVDIDLAPGREEEVVVEVEAINIVTPKIELEYKIVLFDNKLADKQKAGEAKILASATYIQATISQTNTGHPYAKTGKLVFTPANVEVFTDEACTKKLDKDLTAEQLIGTSDQLVGDKPPKYWLRGKTEGKFTVKLTLADPADRFVKLDDRPVPEEKMGCVKLALKLHQQDLDKLKAAGMQVDPDTDPESTYFTHLKDKVIPDQKLMTDDEKIGEPVKDDAAKPGRLLHVQNGAHFGRAKLIVDKINRDHLPDGIDGYVVVLKIGRGSAPDSGGESLKPEELQGGDKDTPKSGSITLFNAEIDGAQKAAVSIDMSVLKDNEQIFWVEGTTETDQPCDIRLDAGMDRGDGGLAKKVKRNGDWTRYTVVKIEEVKLDYTATPGQPNAWNAGEKQFYINMKAGIDGRKVKIAAKLTKRLKNVVLHFMLAPDKDNKKTANWGVDLPSTWKWKDIESSVKHLDKADRKDFLHLSEKTDADGKANKELTLSRFGGDKFQPASYIEQDAHLAKYVEGHADLEKRTPVLATDKIAVWRKFWYREVKVAGITVAGFGNAAETYKDVKTVMEAAPVIEVPRSDANLISPRVIYPKHMVRYHRDPMTNNYVNTYSGDNSDGLIVGDNNESRFMSKVTASAERPVEIPIMNVHGLWIGDGDTGVIDTGFVPFNGSPLELLADLKLLDPPLQGGTLLRAGTWEVGNWDGTAWVSGTHQTGNLVAANVTLSSTRSDPKAFTVNVPTPTGPNLLVRVEVTLRGASSFLGTSYPDGIVNCYTPNDLTDFINTINHEIGHSFDQVCKTPPTGVPAHPHQYDLNGSHCRYTSDSCLMFESGPQAVHLDRFCPVCHPYVLVQEIRK